MIKQTQYKDYYVSDTGSVYSAKRNKIKQLKLEHHNSGYLYVNIYEDGIRKHVRVHRLVAETFIENPNNYSVVNHIDGNKKNNNKENLEWCTISYNTKHAYENNLARNAKGFEDSQSNPVKAIRLSDKEEFIFGSISICSKTLNVSKSTVARQIKGLTSIDYRSKYKFERYTKCNDYSSKEVEEPGCKTQLEALDSLVNKDEDIV